MEQKTAFIAMKFEGVSWNDKPYQIIKEVLEEAGFNVVRADEIMTSGPSVTEVCDYLEKAEIVVIDSTGDSHNVSYEIGYCHGIKRSFNTTILIRKDDGKPFPFNFRHFRYRSYKDLRYLRRLLRDWFSISTPIPNDDHGYVFNFFTDNVKKSVYGITIARITIDYLTSIKFTGRCFQNS